MVDTGQLRHPTSRAAPWKWAFVIGLGATCAAGAVIVDASLAPPPPMVAAAPVAETTAPLEATGTASAGGTALTTAAIVLPSAVATPPPTTSLPPEKPKVAVAKAREATTAKVAGFQSCLPACETRDPRIAGLEPPPMAPLPEPYDLAPPPPPPPRDVVDLALDGGKHLLHRAEGASDAVVHGTKRALDVAMDLVW